MMKKIGAEYDYIAIHWPLKMSQYKNHKIGNEDVIDHFNRVCGEMCVMITFRAHGNNSARPVLRLHGDACREVYKQIRKVSASLFPTKMFPNHPPMNQVRETVRDGNGRVEVDLAAPDEEEEEEEQYEEEEDAERRYQPDEKGDDMYNEEEADYETDHEHDFEAGNEHGCSEVDPAESAEAEHETEIIVTDGRQRGQQAAAASLREVLQHGCSEENPAASAEAEHEREFIVKITQRRNQAEAVSLRGLRTSIDRVKAFVEKDSQYLTHNTVVSVAAVPCDPFIDVADECFDGGAVHVAFYTMCFKRWWQMKDALMANLVLCVADRRRCSFNVAIWEEDPDCQKMLRFFHFFCGDLNMQMCLCVCFLAYEASVSCPYVQLRETESERVQTGMGNRWPGFYLRMCRERESVKQRERDRKTEIESNRDGVTGGQHGFIMGWERERETEREYVVCPFLCSHEVRTGCAAGTSMCGWRGACRTGARR